MLDFCSNISTNVSLPIIPDEPFDSFSDYELRTYTSGCYYLDSDNNWQSDGLVVSYIVCFLYWKKLVFYHLGWTINKSYSNAMFFLSFNNICWWFSSITGNNQLEEGI